MEANNQLKLYSISAAAKSLAIGKDTLYRLVAEGKIGFIEMGKRKKISFNELVRFQSENTVMKKEPKLQDSFTKVWLSEIINPKKNPVNKKLDTRQELKSILGGD